jgi:RNA polymerase sigma factor (sigma-70 family)
MDDAALVEAARGGDGAAWGAIYDRYADKLHDHCHRILRDRDEAADALHDAFIVASHHLDQLRDPSRLRPWLYSICRHESLRRARRRNRVDLTDEIDGMSGPEVDLDRGIRTAELQDLVWSAAAGLSARDQALLDLNLRQGLEGQDLADAMGTSLNNSYVMLSRLRDQVERSLGALLIARLGREDCGELDALLQGWDGKFSPLLRKRVARHVDACDVCRERRAAVASPMALLAASPLMPAPALLRERVLLDIGAAAPSQPVRFTREGFAAPEHGRFGGRPTWWLSAAAILLLAVLGGLFTVGGEDDPAPVAAVVSTTTEAPTSTTDAPSTTVESTTTTTTTDLSPPTTEPAGATSTTDPVVIPPPPPPPDTIPPSIGGLTSQHPEIYVATSTCTPTPKQSVISATIVGAAAATLRWSGVVPDGSKDMSRSGNTWTATLGPFPQPTGGVLGYTVIAEDAAGNRSTRSASIDLLPCPG